MDYCTPEQQENRLNICKECPFFKFRETKETYCESSDLNIDLIIITPDIKCPLEKW